MTIQKAAGIIEVMLFALAVAAALGLGTLVGAAAQGERWFGEEAFGLTFDAWYQARIEGDTLGMLFPLMSIAPTVFLSTVAVALRWGLLRSGKNIGWAWTIVIVMDLALFGAFVGIVLASLAD